MASSSSIASPKLYDAFISHRGPDVKETLAKHLYELLQERGCRAFLDRPEIQVGDSITFAIRNAIISSLVQIAIFSRGYAESPWCLDELLLMLQQQPNALFIPVFYDVEPWELRYIENSTTRYAAAFSDYRSKGRHLDKLDEWKKALESAADISGYQLGRSSNQDNLCENIVSRVLQVVQERKNKILLDVAKYPVGLAELVEDFESIFSETRRDKRAKTMDKVTIAGIYGLGGSGKSTLAKELFNSKSSDYHASSFLFDVRESHARGELHCLQSQLLKDLVKIEDPKISSVDHGIRELKQRLGRARQLNFLIVIDDIDHLDQLDALLPQSMLSSSSLVIITTRDQSMLTDADIRYKMKELNWDDAKDLFCCHAFHRMDPPTAYEKLVESFLQFCGGLPLSLKVLGAHLYGRNEHYWDLELEKVKKIQPKDIMQRLKISFDSLDQDEKQIFVDIACFFNKHKSWDLLSYAISIWNASGWSAEHALQTLQDKCLVEVKYRTFEMHDHLRDLGRHMADELKPPRLWRPDILRSLAAKGFQQILAERKGRCFHSFRDWSSTEITYFMGNSNDSTETDLLALDFECRGSLDENSSKEIPPWVPLRQLHYLSVREVEGLWSTFHQQLQTNPQVSFELRNLRISHCRRLEELPDLIEMFSHLEELYIVDSVEETDITSLLESIKQLSTLRSLHLASIRSNVFCSESNLNLSKRRNSTSSRMTSLETIDFSGSDKIEKLLVSGEFCPRLQSLKVGDFPKLETIAGLSSLTWLQSLTVWICPKLETVPGLSSLTRLQSLTVFGCPKLETMPGLSSLTGLKVFEVNYCEGLKSLPSLAHQRHLEQFKVTGCDELQSVEGFEEWQGLKCLAIEVPKNGYAWVRKCIYGLKMLPSVQTILVGKPVDTTSSKLDVNLFSEVTGIEAVVEMQRGVHDELHMRSSSNAITIYAFLSSDLRFTFIGRSCIQGESIITLLLPGNSSESINIRNIRNIKVNKGFRAVVNKREEGKALTLIQRIVDRLYQ